jgi:hypothetical protein
MYSIYIRGVQNAKTFCAVKVQRTMLLIGHALCSIVSKHNNFVAATVTTLMCAGMLEAL